MKKILSLILMVSIAFALASCSEKITSPEESVKNFFEAVNTYDESKIMEYSSDDNLLNLVKKSEGNKGIDKDLVMFLFSNLSYSIMEINEDGDTCKAEIEITNVDMRNVMGQFMKEALSFALGEGLSSKMTDEDQAEKYKEILNKVIEDNKDTSVTNTVSVDLVKSEKNWKVQISKELINAITGDLANTADSLQQN